MAKEIERKFLVYPKSNEWRLQASKRQLFRQGVLFRSSDDPRVITRIRIIEDNPPQAFVTIKQKLCDTTCNEFEYSIPYDDALYMLNNMCSGRIEKVRYSVFINGKTWVIDEYLNANNGLITAEVELDSEEDTIDLPVWIEKEVTGIRQYMNSELGINPYTLWNDKDDTDNK